MKRIERLDNGLTLITHKLPNTHSVTISANFRVGSIYENIHNNGITHLVEHLFFRRLAKLSQSELYLKMQSIGTEIIGKTFHDYVSFTVTVVSKFFLEALEIVSFLYENFEWNDTEIQLEKNVVLRQIENKYESYSEWCDGCYLRDTIYSLPIIGTTENVLSLKNNEINEWKKRFFTASNSCVVITGNIQEQEFNKAVNKLNRINVSDFVQKTIVSKPDYFNNRNKDNRYCFAETDSKLSEVVIYFDVDNNVDYETINLLISILFEGCGSKFSKELRENYAVTDDIFLALNVFYGYSNIRVSYTVSNDLIDKSLELFFDLLKVSRESISENDYNSSICFFTDNQFMDLDNPKTLNSSYAFYDFVIGSILSEPAEKKEKYSNISIDDLLDCAKQIFTADNISFLFETSIEESVIIDRVEAMLDF